MEFREWISAVGFLRLDFREWISADGFLRMDPSKFAAKIVNFELFSTFPFFESALILPCTDHFKLLVIMHFSAG